MAEAAAAAMEAEKSEKERNGELELDLTQRVESAVTARATYIKEHAESLTMVSFRRLLEEDLGLETTALDPHKKKIKELVDHIMNADDPEVTEAVIRDALAKRSSYLKTDSRNMKLERVRRLLEEDLGLQNFALDTKKELVKSLLDEVLNTSDVTKEEEHSASEVEALETETGTAAEVNEEKKRKLQSAEKSRKKKRLVKKLEETDESEREDSEENKPRKRKSGKKKAIVKDSEDEDEDERKSSNPKSSKDEVHAKKPEETEAEDTKEYNTDSDESPAKKTPKKKAAKAPESKPVVSKVVEQLKQMIKASGINIPPSVYKRVKQVPESKRESSLIKELESILQKEGLNRNSSEKEGRGRRQANLFYEPLPFAKKKRNKTVLSDDEESSKSEGSLIQSRPCIIATENPTRRSKIDALLKLLNKDAWAQILAARTGGEKNPLAPNVCGDENVRKSWQHPMLSRMKAWTTMLLALAKEGAPPDEDTYVLVAQKSRNITVDEAKELQRLVQEKIGDKVVSAMTKGYLALNQHRGANDIAHDMLDKGGGWCRSREWEEAKRVRKLMTDRGIKKEPGKSDQHQEHGRSHPHTMEIYAEVDRIQEIRSS
ncbi:hypothetical protein SELMODRAFT_403074 [Selaginella moellendorffii]|uniref:Uncharacterized protein n=1 Tax=Selaginella moellendorffii TaxID=88036 RepID=D8QNZ0_SELML|nr:hypothetical protein SELMODRAFT_403074 [Selaginella moellendorffii]